MSTTFAIKCQGKFIEVAFRKNFGGIEWTNQLGKVLSSSRRVYAIDNTQQGIYTVGDIKKAVEE